MDNLPPMVRIEIDEMKYSIMHYLRQHHGDVEEQVKKQIDVAIENYDFAGRVTETVNKALDAAIKGYFEYGHGFEAISKAVWESLDNLMK